LPKDVLFSPKYTFYCYISIWYMLIIIVLNNFYQKRLIIILIFFFLLLFQKMSRLCFNKCVIKPGSSLDSTEQVNIFYSVIYFNKVHFSNTIIFLEMCFNVYGPLYGNCESSIQILRWATNGWIPKYALNQVEPWSVTCSFRYLSCLFVCLH